MQSRRVSRIALTILLSLGCCAPTKLLAADAASAGRTLLEQPLAFEPNVGQAPSSYRFLSSGPSYSLGLASTRLDMRLQGAPPRTQSLPYPLRSIPLPRPVSDVSITLVGGNPNAAMKAAGDTRSRSNYFLGSDGKGWKTGVTRFSQVHTAELYPGTDLLFYGNNGRLEYDFTVHPGGDPAQIRMHVGGANLHMDPNGDMRLSTRAGDILLQHPFAYQWVGNHQREVKSAFRIVADSQITIDIGEYDHSQPLVIDPVLVYSAIVDGGFGAEVLGLAADSDGNAYITGNTCSSDFPNTGSLHAGNNPNAAFCEDGFVEKFDPSGNLLFSDVFGGAQADSGTRLAVDSSRNIFIAGVTSSPDFPTTAGAPKGSLGTQNAACPVGSGVQAPCLDGFAMKLSADGSTLLYSTLMGGSDLDIATDIKVDSLGNAYVAGITESSNFVPAPNGLQTTAGGGTCQAGIRKCFDIFIVKINATGTAAPYVTYFGKGDDDVAVAEALDTSNNLYLVGGTHLPGPAGFTVTNTIGPSSGSPGTEPVAWIGKFNISSTPGQVVYSTIVQGGDIDAASGIALDANGNAFVIGVTTSQRFPVTAGAFQSSNQAGSNNFCDGSEASPLLLQECGNAFLLELNPAGSSLVFSTYLGGVGPEAGTGIALDSNANVWVTGYTSSSTFPVTPPPQGTYYPAPNSSFASSGFLTEFNPTGTQVLFSTMLGLDSQGVALAMDGHDNAYVTGTIQSTGIFPETPNIFQFDTTASPSGFVQKWNLTGQQPVIAISTPNLAFGNQPLGVATPAKSFTVTNSGPVPMQIGVQIARAIGASANSTDFVQSNNCGSSLAANGGSCTVNVIFEPQPASNCPTACNSRGAQLIVQSNAPGNPHVVSLNGTTGQGPKVSFTPNPVVFPPQPAGQASTPIDIAVNASGDMELDFSSITFTGANASEFSLGSTASRDCLIHPAPAAGFCDFVVVFTPAVNATGTRTATIVVADNALASPQMIPVSGSITTGAALSLSPVTATIDPSVIGGPSPSGFNVTLTNTGAVNVQITALTLGGADAADFTVSTGNCGALPFTVAKDANCFVHITLAPNGTHGVRHGTLSISTTPSLSLPTVTFQGNAVNSGDPAIKLLLVPDPMDFGAVPVGQTGTGFILTISNSVLFCTGGTICGGNLNVSSVSFTTGASQYLLSPQAGCTPPYTLATGGGCEYIISFSPTAAGAQPGVITVQSNDLQGSVTAPVSGSGVALPNVQLSPPALVFGAQTINTNATQSVTVTNTGSANLTISGANSSDSTFTVQNSTCATPVAPAGSCALTIAFTPTSATNFSGLLTLADNTPGGHHFISLTGRGTPVPNTTSSGATTTAITSSANPSVVGQPVTFTITVTSSTSGTPSGNILFRDGSNILDLAGLDNSGKATEVISNLTAGVHSMTAAYSGDSRFLASTSNVLMQTVTGGTPPASTTTVVTSSANPSTSGQQVTFTATVTSSASGTPTGMVTFADGSATLGTGSLNSSAMATFSTSSLAAGQHPISAAYGGDSHFAASTSASITQTVNTATAPTFTIGASPSSQTVTAGQSTTYTLTVTPQNGSTQTVSLSCSGQPALSTCTPAGGSVALDGFHAAQITVNVTTTAATAALRPGTGAVLFASLVPFLALVFSRRLRRGYGVAIVALALVLIVGCGGGSTGSGGGGTGNPNPGTTKGSYTLTLTGSSGATSKTASVTLTVQ